MTQAASPTRPAAAPPAPAEFYAPYYGEVMRAVERKRNVALTGPAGCGKTCAVKQAAKKKGRKLCTVAGHQQLSVEELRGMPGLQGGNTVFHEGLLTRAVREDEWFLLDEASAPLPGVTMLLNAIVEEGGALHIPETGETLPVGENFRAFLGFNNLGYAGTRPVNYALLVRFVAVECDYWLEDKEVAWLRSRCPRVVEQDCRTAVRVANAIRTSRREGAHEFDFSMRSLLMWVQDADEETCELQRSFQRIVLPKVGSQYEALAQRKALEEAANFIIARQAPEPKKMKMR